MTPAERAFKLAIVRVVKRGEYPSPTAIYKELGRRSRGSNLGGTNLNGRECQWREEELKGLGWIYIGKYRDDGKYNRWTWRPMRSISSVGSS